MVPGWQKNMEAASEVSSYLAQNYTEPGAWDATNVYSYIEIEI